MGKKKKNQYAGSPMPLTPLMPGCPPLTPNGPPYHYSEPIPPAPSLSTSQSQPVFQQKLQYQQIQSHQQHQHQSHIDLPISHSQTTQSQLQQHQQKQQQQTHTHFTSNNYQETYPHSQTYQQPQSQQLPTASSSYLGSTSQTLPHYTQPGQSSQNYQLNGTQQVQFQVTIFLFIFIYSFCKEIMKDRIFKFIYFHLFLNFTDNELSKFEYDNTSKWNIYIWWCCW